MTKACTECAYIIPSKEDEAEPMEEVPENCPKCGGIGTVVRQEPEGEEEGE